MPSWGGKYGHHDKHNKKYEHHGYDKHWKSYKPSYLSSWATPSYPSSWSKYSTYSHPVKSYSTYSHPVKSYSTYSHPVKSYSTVNYHTAPTTWKTTAPTWSAPKMTSTWTSSSNGL